MAIEHNNNARTNAVVVSVFQLTSEVVNNNPCICFFQITKRTYVCSAHFKEEDFKFTLTGIKLLKRGSVPSVFQWSKAVKERKPRTVKVASNEEQSDSDSETNISL